MTLDKSIAMVALQSFKELKSGCFSFEKHHPPWGFRPGFSRSEDRDSPRPPAVTLDLKIFVPNPSTSLLLRSTGMQF
jgi:hypothetical protein